MNKFFKRVALALSLALVASIAVAVPALAAAATTADPAISSVITKNMLMPAGVNTPADMTFTFTFTPAGFNGGASNSGAAHPTLSSVNIVVPAGSATGFSATSNVHAALVTAANQTGVNAGPHDWVVSETVPNPNPSAAGVTYDTTRYILRAHFANPVAPATAMTVPFVEVFNITSAPGDTPIVIGTKRGDGMQFTNIYTPDIGTSTTPALIVSKVIGANRPSANLDTLFPFTLTLTAPSALGTAPGPVVTPVLPGTPAGTFTATITMDDATGTAAPIMVGGVSRPTTVNFTGGVASFQLRDGERLNVATLPAGTTYTLLEGATAQFAPTAIVTQNGLVTTGSPYAPSPPPGYGQSLQVTGAVHFTDGTHNNSAAFTNNLQSIDITGLFVANNAIVIAVALAAVTFVLLLAARARKRIEEAPLA